MGWVYPDARKVTPDEVMKAIHQGIDKGAHYLTWITVTGLIVSEEPYVDTLGGHRPFLSASEARRLIDETLLRRTLGDLAREGVLVFLVKRDLADVDWPSRGLHPNTGLYTTPEHWAEALAQRGKRHIIDMQLSALGDAQGKILKKYDAEVQLLFRSLCDERAIPWRGADDKARQ